MPIFLVKTQQRTILTGCLTCRNTLVEGREKEIYYYDLCGYTKSPTFARHLWLLGRPRLYRHREYGHSLPRRDDAARCRHLCWDDTPPIHSPGDRGCCQWRHSWP